MTRLCSIEGCGGRHEARGYCPKHYARWKKRGSVEDYRGTHVSDEQRFAMYLGRESGGCVLWDGALDKDGYGVFMTKSRKGRAHRFALEQHLGRPIAEGTIVMHTCDNPTCVNPEHLREGTYKENTQDMFSKGRWRHPDRTNTARGETHGNSKLTTEDVRMIRFLRENSVSYDTIQEMFGIGHGTVWNISTRRAWGHVA